MTNSPQIPTLSPWGNFLGAFRTDFPASIIVFLVALPLCMGIATASGAPPVAGLITGIIGGLLVGAISGSPLQVSGPAAGLFVITSEIIAEQGFAALGIIVVGAGLIQMAAGFAKLGSYFRAVSPAVIQGMLSGIGVLIFASQFHVMVDDHDAARPWLNVGWEKGLANIVTMPQSLWLGLVPLDNSPHHLAAAVGVSTILVLMFWKYVPIKSLKIIPGPVVAVVLAAAITKTMGWNINHVDVPDNLLDGILFPTRAVIEGLEWRAAALAAVTVALIASAETMLCCAAVDQMQSHTRTDYNRELLAQGVGNLACGAVGALPMTGVIVRSSANVDAGGRTRLSAWLHGLWLLVFVAALPWVLDYIPMASLAAVLVYTGWKLINPQALVQLWRVSRPEGIIALITLVLVVGIDLLTGVLVGVGCTAAWLLWTFARLEVSVEAVPVENRTILGLKGAATFLAVPKIADALDKITPDTELHVPLERLRYIDHSCLELLVNWEKMHAAQGGKLVIDWDGLATTFRRSNIESYQEPRKPKVRRIDWLRRRLNSNMNTPRLSQLLDNNRDWAHQVAEDDPTFFSDLAEMQKPDYLWIGCSDSRVPANQIVGLDPGAIFVHRNIANVVVHTDVNCLSVIEYAVRVLKVRHIIVCGHYGCGGVAAALGDQPIGLIDNWLRHIRDVRQKYLDELLELPSQKDRVNRLCELNVIEQVKNVCHTSIVQQAWRDEQPLCVHGWIYGIADGLIRDLEVSISDAQDLDEAYRFEDAPVA